MLTCGKGLLAQINENHYYDNTISKEELLIWAKELDEQFKKEYPYCTEQNLITRILKECFSMDKIKLRNRYNEDNYLERIEGDKWKLCLGNLDDASYTRVGLLEGKNWEDKDYYFVDPPGGPFITVGGEIAGKTVYRITSEGPGYIIYLKE